MDFSVLGFLQTVVSHFSQVGYTDQMLSFNEV